LPWQSLVFFAIKWHFDQDKKLKELAEKDKDLKNS
jgi:hypothetical protein